MPRARFELAAYSLGGKSLYPAELLQWPGAATRYRDDWLPAADWVELDGIGHCPQLDVPLETAQLILGFSGD